MIVLNVLRDSPFSILLLDFGVNSEVILESLLKLRDPIVNFLGGLVYLCKCELMVLFSFFILELKVPPLSVLFERLVFLPILDSLL